VFCLEMGSFCYCTRHQQFSPGSIFCCFPCYFTLVDKKRASAFKMDTVLQQPDQAEELFLHMKTQHFYELDGMKIKQLKPS